MAGFWRSVLAAAGTAVVLVVAGCATTGTKVDPAAVNQLQPGVSTEADAARLLGPPTGVMHAASGHTLLTWTYPQETAVGVTSQSVGVAFDETGRMIRVVQTPHVDTH